MINLCSFRSSSLALLLSVTAGGPACANGTCAVDKVVAEFQTPVDIVKKASISEIEKNEMRDVDVDGRIVKVPFGKLNASWRELKSLYRNGDCIVFFRTNQESWDKLYGREGYMLVRKGEIVSSFVTKMN